MIVKFRNLTIIECECITLGCICAPASLSVYVITPWTGKRRSHCQVRLYKATADVGGLRCLISNNMSSGLMNLRQC